MVGTDNKLCYKAQEDKHYPHRNEKKGNQDHGADPDTSPNDFPIEDEKTYQNS